MKKLVKKIWDTLFYSKLKFEWEPFINPDYESELVYVKLRIYVDYKNIVKIEDPLVGETRDFCVVSLVRLSLWFLENIELIENTTRQEFNEFFKIYKTWYFETDEKSGTLNMRMADRGGIIPPVFFFKKGNNIQIKLDPYTFMDTRVSRKFVNTVITHENFYFQFMNLVQYTILILKQRGISNSELEEAYLTELEYFSQNCNS